RRMLHYADAGYSMALSLRLNHDPDDIVRSYCQAPQSSSENECPPSSPPPSSWSWFYREQRRRVWWTIWHLRMIMEVIAREHIPDRDFAVRFPAPEYLWLSVGPDGEVPPRSKASYGLESQSPSPLETAPTSSPRFDDKGIHDDQRTNQNRSKPRDSSKPRSMVDGYVAFLQAMYMWPFLFELASGIGSDAGASDKTAKEASSARTLTMEEMEQRRAAMHEHVVSWFKSLPVEIQKIDFSPPRNRTDVCGIKQEDDGCLQQRQWTPFDDGTFTPAGVNRWLVMLVHILFRAMLVMIHWRKMEMVVNDVIQNQKKRKKPADDSTMYPSWLHDDSVSICIESATIISEILQKYVIEARDESGDFFEPGYMGFFFFRSALIHLFVARALWSSCAMAVTVSDNPTDNRSADSQGTEDAKGKKRSRSPDTTSQQEDPNAFLSYVSSSSSSSRHFLKSEQKRFADSPDSNMYWMKWMMTTRAIWHVQRISPILRTLRILSKTWVSAAGLHDSLTEMTREILRRLGVLPALAAGSGSEASISPLLSANHFIGGPGKVEEGVVLGGIGELPILLSKLELKPVHKDEDELLSNITDNFVGGRRD
ncbi:hypothetical protein HK102_009587, partial [Quaeritorhiza haematococci]